MGRTTFSELMDAAREGGYAVGYFETWNMESLFAVADAAEETNSPVILGWSGIYLPHPDRVVLEHLGDYAALVHEVCDRLDVPCCSLFNESAHKEWLFGAVDTWFDLVIFTDENLSPEEQIREVKEIVEYAHEMGCSVEGESTPLPGAGGGVIKEVAARLSTPEEAVHYVEETGVDAFAVDIGQQHLHGRREVELDIDLLKKIRGAVDVPLVLHGASSISRESIRGAIENGISKINVGSSLKRSFFEAVRKAVSSVEEDYNPYEVVGSGLDKDILAAGRLAVQEETQRLMELFGSRDKG